MSSKIYISSTSTLLSNLWGGQSERYMYLSHLSCVPVSHDFFLCFTFLKMKNLQQVSWRHDDEKKKQWYQTLNTICKKVFSSRSYPIPVSVDSSDCERFSFSFIPYDSWPGFVNTRVSIDNWSFKFFYKYTTSLLLLCSAGTTARWFSTSKNLAENNRNMWIAFTTCCVNCDQITSCW